jgi:hypothetical protein
MVETYSKRIRHLLSPRGAAIVLSAAAFGAPAAASANKPHSRIGTSPASLEPLPSHVEGLYTMAAPDMLPADFSQPSLDAFGAEQVDDLVGFSIDFQQPTLNVAAGIDSLEINYACPPADVKQRTPAIESLQVLPNHQANADFCPSKDIIDVTIPNAADPVLPEAEDALASDTIRQEPWGGDKYLGDNMYFSCPEVPKRQFPRLAFKLKRDPATGNYIQAAFDAGNTSPYCDEVGLFYEKLSVYAGRLHHKLHKVGRSLMEIEGIKDPLMFNPKYKLSPEQIRNTATISDLGNLCESGSKLTMQLRAQYGFIANRHQDFVDPSDGTQFVKKYVPMRSGSRTYKGPQTTICKTNLHLPPKH